MTAQNTDNKNNYHRTRIHEIIQIWSKNKKAINDGQYKLNILICGNKTEKHPIYYVRVCKTVCCLKVKRKCLKENNLNTMQFFVVQY